MGFGEGINAANFKIKMRGPRPCIDFKNRCPHRACSQIALGGTWGIFVPGRLEYNGNLQAVLGFSNMVWGVTCLQAQGKFTR